MVDMDTAPTQPDTGPRWRLRGETVELTDEFVALIRRVFRTHRWGR